MKRLICIILTLGILISFNTYAVKQEDLDKSVQKQEELKDSIAEEKVKKAEIDKKVEAVVSTMNEMYGVLNEIQASLDELNAKKDKLNAELYQAEVELENQTKTLKTRLRVVHEEGISSYLKILFSSESIFDFVYNFEVIKQISEYDNKVLKEIEVKKAEIEKAKAELQVIIDEEAAKKQAQQAKVDEVRKEEEKYQQLQMEIAGNIEEYQKKLDAAEAEEQRIRNELAELARQEELKRQQKNGGVPTQSSVKGNGSMIWPASGTITSEFNPNRLHPIFKTVRAHRGIDIGVPTGTPVYAAASGTVIKSLYNGSYGYYVAIDHGGGIVTLYAHNSQLLVSAGQTVTQGQTIAKAGSTGNSTGPHVHFEVQVNGSVVNPRNYF